MMKGKLLLTRPGGGAKTEIRPNLRGGGGWLVLEFEYASDGSREKTSETRAATDDHVIELMQQDPEFFRQLKQLAEHPELQQ